MKSRLMMDISLQNPILNVAHSFVPVELVFLFKKQWNHRFLKIKGGPFQWSYKNYCLSSQTFVFLYLNNDMVFFVQYISQVHIHIFLTSIINLSLNIPWKSLYSIGSKFFYYPSKKKRFFAHYISKTSKSIRPLVVLEWITLVCCDWRASTVPEELQHTISLLT